MNETDGATLLAVLINWFPTIVFGSIWLFYIRRSIALQKAGNEELRRSAAALEQVAARLENRA